MLTPHEVEQLVSLRLGLEDAVQRAKRAGKYQRGAAIVALDATVERASSIVAVTRGISVPRNVSLNDLISKLKQDLEGSWNPGVLPDIHHLRRARNAAQHEGLEPDREQVPHWASAAETYVAGLIDTQFQVDVRRVVLSDAIQDTALRKGITDADSARNEGDYRCSVDKAAEAYRDASSRWSRLRARHTRHSSPFRSDILDQKSYNYLDGRITSVQSVLATAAFSSDSAEAEWFTATISEQGDVLDAEDAERVLTFAFKWIVEYERAADSWTPDRQHRAAVARRQVRLANAPARIGECLSLNLQHDEIHTVFQLADVPPENDYAEWSRELQKALPSGQPWWRVEDDGTVKVIKNFEESPNLASEVSTLADALVRVHSNADEEEITAEKNDREAQEKRAAFAESINSIKANFPSWVENIEQSSDGGPPEGGDQIILRVTADVYGLRFGDRSPNNGTVNRGSLRDKIIGHELVEQCYFTGTGCEFGIQPVLEAPQLENVLAAVDKVVCEQLTVDRQKKQAREQAVAQAKASIAAKLGELGSGTHY